MSCFVGMINCLFGEPFSTFEYESLATVITFSNKKDKEIFDNSVKGESYMYVLALPDNTYHVGYTDNLKVTLEERFSSDEVCPLYVSKIVSNYTQEDDTLIMRKIYGPENINS